MFVRKEIVRVLDRLLFGGRWLSGQIRDENPSVGGYLKMRMRERGKIVPGSHREGSNIWTLTGREFLVERMTLATLTPSRTFNRDDALLYFGMGTGTQPEVAQVSKLQNPIEYTPGEFLAPARVPVTFPSAVGAPRTSVRLVREYGAEELSLGGTVLLTEFGCFTDGDPASGNIPGRPTDFSTASLQAPVGYKTFDPLPNTTGRELEVIYEVRVL